MVEGALILLAGILIGRFFASRRKDPDPKPVEAVCGCKHHHSMHVPETGACNARERGDHAVDLGDRDLQAVADDDVLDPPEDLQAAVPQVGEVTACCKSSMS